MYIVGQLETPEDDDPRFYALREALITARDLSQSGTLYGVWDEDGECLRFIVREQDIYELNGFAVEDAREHVNAAADSEEG